MISIETGRKDLHTFNEEPFETKVESLEPTVDIKDREIKSLNFQCKHLISYEAFCVN